MRTLWHRRYLESLPLEVERTADVSPIAVTIDDRKLLISFRSGQNRTQEADGSIPFSSTTLLMFFGAVMKPVVSRNSSRIFSHENAKISLLKAPV